MRKASLIHTRAPRRELFLAGAERQPLSVSRLADPRKWTGSVWPGLIFGDTLGEVGASLDKRGA
uniref:Uncharacterized protein n=1 Tax=Candidozyma auris TaxID=498019 RepID=A0A0L0NPS3_CANAR